MEAIDPRSLDELINRFPDVSDEEADQIIARLREQREKWAASEAAPKAKKAKGPTPEIDIDDLLKNF